MKTYQDVAHIAADLAEVWKRGNRDWVVRRIFMERRRHLALALAAEVAAQIVNPQELVRALLARNYT